MSDTEKIKRLEERVAVLEAMVARLNRETKAPAVGTPFNPMMDPYARSHRVQR